MDQIEFRPMQTAENAGQYNHANASGAGGCMTCRSREDTHMQTDAAENAGQYSHANASGAGGCMTCRSCEGTHMQVAHTRDLEETGRVLDVTLTLKNVCPCRSVSVCHEIYELDEQNNEHSCGFKAYTVQPHYNPRPCDIELDTVRFILPDDARVCSGTRRFIVRSDAHYAGDYANLNR